MRETLSTAVCRSICKNTQWKLTTPWQPTTKDWILQPGERYPAIIPSAGGNLLRKMRTGTFFQQSLSRLIFASVVVMLLVATRSFAEEASTTSSEDLDSVQFLNLRNSVREALTEAVTVSHTEEIAESLSGSDTTEEEELNNQENLLEVNLETTWSIEEKDKKTCCQTAFSLCERPPGMSQKQFRNTRPKFLQQAKARCAKVGNKLSTEKQICAFYRNNVVNCAFTPNTADDWNMYFDQLPECCSRASEYCETQNPTSLFIAKRECLGYAARTPETICQQAQSKDCQMPTSGP